MSKSASQRRFQRRAADLAELLSGDPLRFTQVWNALCRGWTGEIHARARAWRLGGKSDTQPGLFEVFEQARRLACAAGAEHHGLVAKSLIDLQHLCSQAVAHCCDPHLYRFHEDCTTRVRRCVGGWA